MDGPVHLEGGRTGGSRRPLVALVLVVTFLALAIAKPWGDEVVTADISRPLPSPSTAPRTPDPSTPRPSPDAIPAVVGVDPIALPFVPSAEALWAATQYRAEWGIRMVVFAPAPGSTRVDERAMLTERWIAAVPDADGRGAGARGLPALPGDLVMAIGITAPGGMNVDRNWLRIWRAEEGDLPQRIPIELVPGGSPQVGLFTPGGVATSLASWPRGSYRLDVLLPDGLARMRTVVPTAAPAAVGGRPLPMGPAPELPAVLRDVASGLFVVSGPEVVRLEAVAGPVLDERAIWTEGCRPGGGPCAVGVIESRTVSGVGVVLRPGEELESAVLELLGPAARRPHVIESRLQIPGGSGGGRIGLMLGFDSPGPLASGMYRLTVALRATDGGLRTDRWHLEIAPPGTY